MLATDLDHPRPRTKEAVRREKSVDRIVALMIGALAVAVIVCVAALAPAVWTAGMAGSTAPAERLEQCVAIKDGSERLACYDRFVSRSRTPPAKGALAPALTNPIDRSHPQFPF